jgi:hypothetical protein
MTTKQELQLIEAQCAYIKGVREEIEGMSKAKHTPGPWKVRERIVNGKLVDCFVQAPSFQGFAYGSEILGDDEYSHDNDRSRKLADARLIAAAPELLEALHKIVTELSQHRDHGLKGDPTFYAINTARAAIAKAKGE